MAWVTEMATVIDRVWAHRRTSLVIEGTPVMMDWIGQRAHYSTLPGLVHPDLSPPEE